MRKVVLPRYDSPPDEGPGCFKVLGGFLMVVGACASGFSMMAAFGDRFLAEGAKEDLAGFLPGLVLGVIGLAMILTGALLIHREEKRG